MCAISILPLAVCIFPAPKNEWDILFSLPDQPPPANLPMPTTPAGAR
jgi:hypothetical protein